LYCGIQIGRAGLNNEIFNPEVGCKCLGLEILRLNTPSLTTD